MDPQALGEVEMMQQYSIAENEADKYDTLGSRAYSEDAIVVPILMYHHIEPVPAGIENKNVRDLYVSPTMFERQVKYLYLSGYETVTLSDLVAALRGNKQLPEKSVIITFDDLFPSQVENGIPILDKYGFKSIFFVNVYSGKEYNDNIQKVIDSGHEIGSHGYNHADVRSMNANQLDFEMGKSKTVLENRFGIKINHFAYPGCNYSSKAIRAAKNIGYKSAVICVSPWNGHEFSDRYHLARRLISNDFNRFVARIEDKKGVW